MSFAKILIANRGEIACRIMRTARALGFGTVAVYSEADAGAPHVETADQAVCIGPPPVRESYLSIPAIIAAAKLSGADAIHPGYGFLSENSDFAQACLDAGLTFIGPPPSAIAAMGNKAAAKRLMIDAGVPTVPGYQGNDQTDATLMAEARAIGLPVMVKAAAGGGGRGMRLVIADADLGPAIATARAEAESAFGSGELILEKAVVGARHIEIQVFADTSGNVIHLGERDCSVQRRHQKVIEEAPSPAVSSALRAAMGDAAVAAARAIGYVGAGTVEFLLGQDGAFYFLEMNTRLQVEHPVTEAITGLDLVAWQIKVAQGEPLPLTQDQIRFDGHAIEVRLYAEDPYQGFLPQSGRLIAWQPPTGAGIRVDHGLRSGQEISPWYDPMIAKIIAHGKTRAEACRRLTRALGETVALGVKNNRSFLIDMLTHPVFVAGAATTSFIPDNYPAAVLTSPAPSATLTALAAAMLYDRSIAEPRTMLTNWHSNAAARWPLLLDFAGSQVAVTIALDRAGYRVANGDQSTDIQVLSMSQNDVRFSSGGVIATARYALESAGRLHLDLGRESGEFADVLFDHAAGGEAGASARVAAPMNGRIVAVLVTAGQTVRKGERLVVLEAMKMQHELTAARDGIVETIAAAVGDQVAIRQTLVSLVE